MEDKRTRYVVEIFLLDKANGISCFTWRKDDIEEFYREEEKHYGTKIISDSEEIYIVIEYDNIIWDYKMYFGSNKKKFKHLDSDDERWEKIDNAIGIDLKIIGLENLKEKIINCLKKKEKFIYMDVKHEQFKKYCIKT